MFTATAHFTYNLILIYVLGIYIYFLLSIKYNACWYTVGTFYHQKYICKRLTLTNYSLLSLYPVVEQKKKTKTSSNKNCISFHFNDHFNDRIKWIESQYTLTRRTKKPHSFELNVSKSATFAMLRCRPFLKNTFFPPIPSDVDVTVEVYKLHQAKSRTLFE